jgi:SAM-dependent methyltransferase
MKQVLMGVNEVLGGYDAVSAIYPYVPSVSLWRAWEFAAYRRYSLKEPVLDVGCGDGGFFRLVWPSISDVTGVDMNPTVVEAARRSAVYKRVDLALAHQLPGDRGTFASAFANCSIEHMDHLPEVLTSIRRSLRTGAMFLLSVVTDKFNEWATLPLLIERMGQPEWSRELRRSFKDYHHLVNPLPPDAWIAHLLKAGFDVIDHIPIVPEVTSRLFLLVDQLWHVESSAGALGDAFACWLVKTKDFPRAFRQILAGALMMERDWSIGSGAVFVARSRT